MELDQTSTPPLDFEDRIPAVKFPIRLWNHFFHCDKPFWAVNPINSKMTNKTIVVRIRDRILACRRISTLVPKIDVARLMGRKKNASDDTLRERTPSSNVLI